MRKTLVSAVAAVLAVLLPAAPSISAPEQPAGQLVQEVAGAGTPHVLNGEVYSVVQVGPTMVLGGTFTSARNDNSSTPLTRNRLLAFNATSGQISATFLPNPNGTVRVVLPAGDGETVYVGGSFTSIGGVPRDGLARVRVSDGAVVPTFNAGNITGVVRDLRLSEGMLWLAGAFTHVGGRAQAGLTTVDPTTGGTQTFMAQQVAGIHNGGATQVLKMDVSPDGDRLVAVGNFDTLGGLQRHQLLMVDMSGLTAQVAGFRTTFYHEACSQSFDSYMRDVDFSPDGSFFVVSTTGAYGGSETACDTAARFETNQSGADIRPSWVDYTGGDTSYAVEVTDSAVYIGGHQRWWNNPFRGDAAGPGAVSREGIAALDPVNGLPLSWDPTRTKGVGVFDFLDTPQGLWVASDTDRIGNFQLKSRIARMLPGGTSFPAVRTTVLPNDVYTAAVAGGFTRRRYTSTVGPPQSPPTGGISWGTIRGAFMINGRLYLAHSDGSFTRRTFDGTNYGAPAAVDTHDEIVVLTDWRFDIQNATSMFFDGGRIYFTRTGSNQLFYRYFSPENDVVGAKRLVASNNVSGIDFAQTRGMFVTGTHLYWSSALDGNLRRMSWQQMPQSGVPAAGTAEVVSGPGVDGVNWLGARSHFLFQGADGGGAVPVNQPPTARFDVSCEGLTCSCDAGTSTDDEGIASYDWDFGDGETGAGQQVEHTYASAGTRTVTLTVTDVPGLQDTEQRQVGPTLEGVQFIGAASANANTTTHRVAVPAGTQPGDALVLFLTSNNTSATVGNPAGWTTLQTLDGVNVRGRAWTRTATASDIGSMVTVTTSGLAKAAISVASYRATGGAGAVVHAHAGRLDSSGGTSFASPASTLTQSGSWVVSYWAGKASVPVSWTAPAGETSRSSSAGSGGGAVFALLTDGGSAGVLGEVGGLVAQTNVAVPRVVTMTVVIGPG